MKSNESEYKQLFLLEAKENIQQLDNLFVKLEKSHNDTKSIKEIFRITHTLKGNAMGMGFDAIAEVAHLMEDVMLAIQEKKVDLDQDLFQLLFRANDKLSALILALETDKRVSYLGIKTSLSLFLEKALKDSQNDDDAYEPAGEVENVEENETVDTEDTVETNISLSDVIQIPLKKMDDLMNEMGQLVIERDRLLTLGALGEITSAELEPLKRLTSELQYSIMNIRMVKVGFLFDKFHRVVRDAAAVEQKSVNLETKGTEVEIDRNILKIITDSLIHLVRNSVGHGIEKEEVRLAASKTPVGNIILDASYLRDRVVISVSDDGHGMDVEKLRAKIVSKGLVKENVAAQLKENEVIQYIFEAGFSNAETVNEISGRGVGMDVVKRAVESVGGQVKVKTSLGVGTTISLELPSSLALKGVLLVDINGHEYGIALAFAEAVVKVKKEDIRKIGAALTADYHGEAITAIFIQDVFDAENLDKLNIRGSFQKFYDSMNEESVMDMIIVTYGDRKTGIIVNKVIQQKEVIEKPFAKPLNEVKVLSGATILGTGKVCPILEIGSVVDIIYKLSIHHQDATN